MSLMTRVLLLSVCVVVAGCDGDELAPPGQPDDELVTLDPAADAGAAVEPAADAGSLVVDAGELARPDAAALPAADAALPAVDGAVDVSPVLPDAGAPGDAGEPAPEPARCTAVWYRDTDRDGFGAIGSELVSCAAPYGYVATGGDCYDGNADAHPGQTVARGEHRGDGSFDFDCDGVETSKADKLATCPVFTAEDAHCPPSAVPRIPTDAHNQYECFEAFRDRVMPDLEGWADVVPACGEVGKWSITIAFSRETSWTCGPHRPDMLRVRSCR